VHYDVAELETEVAMMREMGYLWLLLVIHRRLPI
jgi:hypothetical protein